MEIFQLLKSRGVTRRDFIKLVSATTAALGLPAAVIPRSARAVETAMKKPPVIWMEGLSCTGCTCSLLSSLNPSAAEVVLDMVSIRFHDAIMAASGEIAEEALHHTLDENFILVLEGSIPTKDGRYCMVAGKPFGDKVLEVAAKAQVIVAVGSCAVDGAGIPGAADTGSVGIREFLRQNNIDKTVINLPCCPVKPNTLLGTLLFYLTYKEALPLDPQGRPMIYFGNLLHDNCPRRGQFELGNFLLDWNDPQQKDYCLLLMGCKGPKAYTDCAQAWWNDNANFCINAGSPCSGCSEGSFYNDFSPLYAKQEMFKLPGIGQIHADTVGKVVGVASVAGIGLHLAASAATGRLKKKDHGQGEE